LSREASPTQGAEASELADRLRAALPHLSQDQAAVFCLSSLENLSYQEIGERLGMTANAVGVVLHRARHRLRGLLSSVDTEGSDGK
jgi:RNA polymerase sigma-70 factor, ECF subfamily